MKKVVAVVLALALGGAPAFSQAAARTGPVVTMGLSLDIGLKATKVGEGGFETISYASDVLKPGAQGTLSVSSNSDYFGAQLSVSADETGAKLGSSFAWYELADRLFVNAGTSYSFVSFAGLAPQGGDFFWNPGYGVTYSLGDLSLGASIAPVKDLPNRLGFGIALDLPTLFSVHASANTSGLAPENFGVSANLSAVDYLSLSVGYSFTDLLKEPAQVVSANIAYAFLDPFTAGVTVYDRITEGQYVIQPHVLFILTPEASFAAYYKHTTDGTKTAWDREYQAKVEFRAGDGGLAFWYQYNTNARTGTAGPYSSVQTIGADYVISF